MERFMTRATVYVLLEDDGKILMFKRKNTNWFDGFYNLPCGHINGHETLRQAAVREAKEEVGVDIDLDDLEFAQIVHRISDSAQGYFEYIETYFKVKKWKNKPFLAEEDSGEDLVWLDTNHLPENTLPYTKEAIDHILAGDYYSESGWNE